MEKKLGCRIVRDMIERKLISKYRLAKEMGVSENAVYLWYDGKCFNDARLEQLKNVRDKWMRLKEVGIYSKY